MTSSFSVPRSAILSLAALTASLVGQGRVERVVCAMGTTLTVAIDAPTRPAALLASEAAVRAVEAVEARLSVWREDSDVSRVNAAKPGRPVLVHPDTAADLRWAFHFGRQLNGAFDPTIGPLVATYNLRGTQRWPTAAERASAVAVVGAEFFAIDDAAMTRRCSAAQLDCDAFGKGIALDRALAAAVEAGARRVWLDFGGQVAIGGAGAAPIEVRIADPADRTRTCHVLRLLPGSSAATSGNGERRLTVDGRQCGHILDPRTGLFAPDFGSVTVIAPSAAVADAAATALFVLGPDRGRELAARLDIQAFFAVRSPQ